MTSDIFAQMRAVQHFLADDVADQVPLHLRAGVRAAAKLLRDIAREADALPALLYVECTDMLAVCEAALSDVMEAGAPMDFAAARRQIDQAPGPLSAQIQLHQDLRAAVELILIALIDAFDDAPAMSGAKAAWGQRIAAIYRLLARQADARIHWQSVFPAPSKTTKEHP